MKNLKRLTDFALRIPIPHSARQSESEILARIAEIDRRVSEPDDASADLEFTSLNSAQIYEKLPDRGIAIYKQHIIAWGEDMMDIKRQMGDNIWNKYPMCFSIARNPKADYIFSAS